jgi:hypothetical protein
VIADRESKLISREGFVACAEGFVAKENQPFVLVSWTETVSNENKKQMRKRDMDALPISGTNAG